MLTLHYRCHIETTEAGRTVKKTGEIMRSGERVMFILGDTRVCKYEEGAFAVEHNKQGDQWLLRRYARVDSQDWARNPFEGWTFAIHPLTALSTRDQIRIELDAPVFRPTAVSFRSNGLIDLTFASEGAEARRKNGTITVSPQNHYAVVKWTHTIAKTDTSAPIKYSFTREIDDSGMTLRCKSVHAVVTHAETGRELTVRKITYSDYSTTLTDPSEFTLNYYNLPTPSEAPEDIPASQRSSWYWWVGVGTVCVVLSLVVARIARRRSSNRRSA